VIGFDSISDMQIANALLQEIQDHLLNAQKQECMINLHYCSKGHISNIKLAIRVQTTATESQSTVVTGSESELSML